jgi:hypothetical protein
MAVLTLDKRLFALETKNTKLEPLLNADVKFVFDLRRSDRTMHMKAISSKIEDQYSYFEEYLERFHKGSEIYFKIIDQSTNTRVGVVRLTEIDQIETFCWESLATIPGTRAVVAIDTMCLIYHAGFNILERTLCTPFVVPKKLTRLIKLHETMGMADKVGESGPYWLYQITKCRFTNGIDRIHRMGFGILNA